MTDSSQARRPTPPTPESLSPDIASPLSPFKGSVPDSPAWFDQAMAQKPERLRVPVRDSEIEVLTWGKVGNPGLLLLHGNGAHAEWWSFIAPFFAADWRVAAMSWSGMGESGWRDLYSAEIFADEIFAACEAAGFDAAGVKPTLVGHSFGGFPCLYVSTRMPDRVRGVVLLDCTVHPPERQWRGPPQSRGVNRIYPDLETALARFRFAPPQGCENLYIADHIARTSLKQVPLEDGSGMGWTWKFDPLMWGRFQMPPLGDLLSQVACPMVLMWGERSNLMNEETLAYMVRELPETVLKSPMVGRP